MKSQQNSIRSKRANHKVTPRLRHRSRTRDEKHGVIMAKAETLGRGHLMCMCMRGNMHGDDLRTGDAKQIIRQQMNTRRRTEELKDIAIAKQGPTHNDIGSELHIYTSALRNRSTLISESEDFVVITRTPNRGFPSESSAQKHCLLRVPGCRIFFLRDKAKRGQRCGVNKVQFNRPECWFNITNEDVQRPVLSRGSIPKSQQLKVGISARCKPVGSEDEDMKPEVQRKRYIGAEARKCLKFRGNRRRRRPRFDFIARSRGYRRES